VIPGTAFGTTQHLRISYAYNMDMLKKGILRIQNCLNALK